MLRSIYIYDVENVFGYNMKFSIKRTVVKNKYKNYLEIGFLNKLNLKSVRK